MEMNGDKPVTRNELRTELNVTKKDLRDEMVLMRGELRDEMGQMRDGLRSEMGQMRDGLRSEMGQMRGELTAKVDKLAMEFVGMKADMREMKTNMSTKADIERVLSAVTNFAGRAERYDQSETSRSNVMDKHGKLLGNHEERIQLLESEKKPD